MLAKEQKTAIEYVLSKSIQNKLKNFKTESTSAPFRTRLLGKDRLALYSFIHSLNTNFGTSIFEPVGLALAQNNFKMAVSQATAGDQISTAAQAEIQKIIDGLITATNNFSE